MNTTTTDRLEAAAERAGIPTRDDALKRENLYFESARSSESTLNSLAAELAALRAAMPIVARLRSALASTARSGALIGVEGSTVTLDLVTEPARVEAVRDDMRLLMDALIETAPK